MDIALVLNFLRPNEQWTLDGNTYDGLTWLDETQKPTLAQLEAVAEQAEAQRQAELEAREQLRQSAISKLVAGQPLTTAEAELLVIR